MSVWAALEEFTVSVIRHSGVYIYGQAGTLVPLNDTINGVAVPTVILGDAAYLFLPCFMKLHPDFRGSGKRRFVYTLSR